VVKFDPVRRAAALGEAGVERQHFVDDERAARRCNREEWIRRARRRRVKEDDVRGTIGAAALRNILALRLIPDAIDRREVRQEQTDLPEAAAEAEVQMVGA